MTLTINTLSGPGMEWVFSHVSLTYYSQLTCLAKVEQAYGVLRGLKVVKRLMVILSSSALAFQKVLQIHCKNQRLFLAVFWTLCVAYWPVDICINVLKKPK